MNLQLSDFSEKIKTRCTAESVALDFIEFAERNGACTVTTFFGTETKQQFVSTIPLSFMNMFHENGSVHNMHTVKSVRAGKSQNFYGIDLCPQNPNATPEGMLWADQVFDHFNSRSGVTFSMPDRNGQYAGAGMGMGFEDTGECFLKLMAESGGTFGTAAFLAFSRMELLYKPDILPSPLSHRQQQILQLLSKGYRTDVIADKLSISNSAVNLYLANLKKKLKVKTREQALAMALLNEWIEH